MFKARWCLKNVVIDDDESTNDHLLGESEKYYFPSAFSYYLNIVGTR